jgi:hypothetical protein
MAEHVAADPAAAAQHIVALEAQLQQQQQARAQLEAELAQLRAQVAPAAATPAAVAAPTAAPKLKLPRPPETNGRNPSPVNWSYKVEAYLQAEGYNLQHEPAAVTFAAAYLKDSALKWHRQHALDVQAGRKTDYAGWIDFKTAFIKRFTPVDPAVTARERLDRCRQTKSAYLYTSDFDSLVLELPNMDEADKLHKYISGLKPSLKMHVTLQRPKTLAEAQDLAIRADNSMWALRDGRSARGGDMPRSASSHASAAPAPMELDRMEPGDDHEGQCYALNGSNKPRNTVAATTGDNDCWYCGKPGHYRRECRRMKADRASGKLKPSPGCGDSGGPWRRRRPN